MPLTPALPSATLPWQRSLRAAGLVIGGTLVLAASAKVQVPFWPVPATLQSLAVPLLAMAYGSRLGVATVLAYLAEGLAGVPVFAGISVGVAPLVGPTGGYLFGFLLAAGVIGGLAERGWGRGWRGAAGLMALGHVLILGPGVLWLATLIGWPHAVAAGLTPFLAATAVKVALGSALATAARRRFGPA